MDSQGIKLNFLLSLVNRPELRDLSSEQIIERVIKPLTATQKCSYVQFLSSQEETKDQVLEANIFLSHSWRTSFVEVVNAVRHWVYVSNKKMEEVVIWMDIFSVNQHETSDSPTFDFESWTIRFRVMIEKIHSVLVFCAPWNNPVPLTRGWCLWEIYLAVVLHCQFDLIFNENEEGQFANDISNFGIELVKRMTGDIDSRRGRCSLVEVEERIHDCIEKTVGFDNLNKFVHTAIRRSLIGMLQRIVRDSENNLMNNKGFLLSGLASLYCYQGELENAVTVCKEAIQVLDNASHESLYEQMLLGEVYLHQRKYDEAFNIFIACNDHISHSPINSSLTTSLNDFNPINLRDPCQLFIQCQKGLAEVLIKLGKYEQAEAVLLDTFKRLNIISEHDYSPTFKALSNLLIESYEKQGKFELLEKSLKISYRNFSQYLGERHPDTLTVLFKLATFHQYRDHTKSEKLFRKCLTVQQSGLPKDHPETLRTATGLAILLTKMSRFDEAEDLFRIVIDGNRSFNHYEALFSSGRCLMEERKLDEAEPLLIETFEGRKRDFGADHSDTLIAMKQIVEFHQMRGCEDKASELQQRYIVLRRDSLARYLPDKDNFLGIKLSSLERFLTTFGGENFVATRDIKGIILKETMQDKCSYCDMLRKRNSGDSSVGKATVFVSHYWGNKITQLVAILKHHFSSFETEAERDPYLWIDLFSFNQHITTNFNFFGSIEAIIANINNTVMVFEAWNSPLPLTRAWCIWELYCTIDTNSTFTIAFGGEGEVGIEGGGLEEVLDSIKCEESQCEFERDRVRIYETILRSITFPKLNSLIKEVITSKIGY